MHYAINWLYPNTRPAIIDEVRIYEGDKVKINVPEYSLSVGSVKILAIKDSFSDWDDSTQCESFKLMQKVAQAWENEKISYLIFGKITKGSIFSWELVPYQKNGWRFWKQFKILWNITFGGICLPIVERIKMARDFKNRNLFSETQVRQIENISLVANGNDAFCDPVKIERQLIFQGRSINVLYNYAPLRIGKEKLHFLLVPREHRLKFSEISEAEYYECSQISQKLINHYRNNGFPTAYLYDRTGEEAGQTVPHWHRHVVFTETQTQEFLGKLSVLKNMLFGSWPLLQKELSTRVDVLRSELVDVLKNMEEIPE